MPQKKCHFQGLSRVPFGFRSRFWFLFVFCAHFLRLGEAAVPGPVSDPIASPDWFLPHTPDFCIGTMNPSGITNKLDLFGLFPPGWWHVAETQASQYQQCLFQQKLGAIARAQNRVLRSCLGAPAPLRAGSDHAGSWTGVLSFGDCPLRGVPMNWPHGEFASGRICVATAYMFGIEVSGATVYLPPRGPTHPDA